MGSPGPLRLRVRALRFGGVKLLREPLVQFLVIGAMLFAVHAAFKTREAEEAAGSPPVIQITAADADWLKEMWARQWRRAPTHEELIGLIADHLREEVLAREARELQLDVGDTVVRRRLAQKMAFLLEDTVRVSEPPEKELRALYNASPDIAALPARVSFRHVFFTGQKGSDAAARVAFAALSDAPNAPGRGDRFLLGDAFADQDEQSLSNLFGQTFAQAVFSFQRGLWSGPLHSDYGVHLVQVTDVQPSQTRAFHEVRDRLAQEWHRQQQENAKQQLYAGLMRKYRIVADPTIRALLPSILAESETER